MKRYFFADCDKDGECISESIFEINLEQELANTKEQIQEDIISVVHSTPYGDENQELADDLCQVVVDNFKKLEIDEKKVWLPVKGVIELGSSLRKILWVAFGVHLGHSGRSSNSIRGANRLRLPANLCWWGLEVLRL